MLEEWTKYFLSWLMPLATGNRSIQDIRYKVSLRSITYDRAKKTRVRCSILLDQSKVNHFQLLQSVEN